MQYTFIMENTPIGSLLLTGDDEALLRLDFMNREHACPAGFPLEVDYAAMRGQAAKTPNPVLQEAVTELADYFAKGLQVFKVPLKLNYCGTAFQQKCWQALTRIPYGATLSYKDIAESVGSPKACRAVGGANHNNPIAIIVPCHRVIGANKEMVGYGGGMWRKQWLLALEQQNTPLI